jgi:hypothetical protein
MSSMGRAIQAVIVFSTLLGVVFLWQVDGLVPPPVFDFVATGWVLFVIDCALTFVKPRASYALGLVLALLALATSLPESAHYAFIQEGAVLPAAIFLTGTGAQLLLIGLVSYYFVSGRGRSASGPAGNEAAPLPT